MKLLFASQNNHKKEELAQVKPPGIELVSLKDLGFTSELEEDFETIEENAVQKARFAFHKYGMDVISEDSALEVESLQGAPGVHTAHFAGPERNANDNIELLLNKLLPYSNRKARFRTVICLMLHGEEYLFEGICNGTITTSRRGTTGFGYDPVFMPDGYNLTFAEMQLSDKISISHRTQAAKKLFQFINTLNRK